MNSFVGRKRATLPVHWMMGDVEVCVCGRGGGGAFLYL